MTKIYVIMYGLSHPICFMLSKGQTSDSLIAIDLLSPIDIANSNILADKVYGLNEIREYIKK